MRYFPAAAALSLLAVVSASAGFGEERQPDPRALALVEAGRSDLARGNVDAAIDNFEAALAVDPGYTPIYLDLAKSSRLQGLQGKAIHYYRETLEREPENLAAIAGEGEALLEKGAIEKSRRNLAQLQTLCGPKCAETMQLSAALERGPKPALMAAESVTPESAVTQN